MYDLWEAFNDIAEGFGLTVEEFQEIIKSSLMEYLGVTEKMLNVDTDIVFRTFDDDEVSVFLKIRKAISINFIISCCYNRIISLIHWSFCRRLQSCRE